ncbi:MAG: hypothetical protein ACPGJS_21200 [Flammeovirgaceae bacterium]
MFDVESIVNTASDLKYSKQIREILSHELKEPSEEFVKYFASKVYTGRVTQRVLEQFTTLVQKSGKNLINEMINDRLRTALDNEEPSEAAAAETLEAASDPNGIVTTEEELEAFNIIKAILRKEVALDRIFSRDTKSYFGVLLDDNNRKPICRLHFNSSNKKYLGLFTEAKKEEKVLIEKLEDIYEHADRLRATLTYYQEV